MGHYNAFTCVTKSTHSVSGTHIPSVLPKCHLSVNNAILTAMHCRKAIFLSRLSLEIWTDNIKYMYIYIYIETLVITLSLYGLCPVALFTLESNIIIRVIGSEIYNWIEKWNKQNNDLFWMIEKWSDPIHAIILACHVEWKNLFRQTGGQTDRQTNIKRFRNWV